MPDHFVRLIPCIHTYRTNENSARAAVELLKTLVEAEEVSFCQRSSAAFVGSGAPERIVCPRCGAAVDRAWWREKLEEMERRDHFFILEQEMPCCGKEVSFNQLKYEPLCGFSALEFTIKNPKAPVTQEVIDRLSGQFGLLFRKVETDAS